MSTIFESIKVTKTSVERNSFVTTRGSDSGGFRIIIFWKGHFKKKTRALIFQMVLEGQKKMMKNFIFVFRSFGGAMAC